MTTVLFGAADWFPTGGWAFAGAIVGLLVMVSVAAQVSARRDAVRRVKHDR